MLPNILLFAGVTSAFLVVPESLSPKVKDIKEANDEENAFNILPIDVTSSSSSKSDIPLLDLAIAGKSEISVPCGECTHGNALHFDFTVQESTRLLLNDFEIFPEPEPLRESLTAEVDGREGGGGGRIEQLGYSILTTPRARDEEQGMEVTDIEIKVLAVGRKLVRRVPSVKVSVLTTENGMVYIGSTKVLEVEAAKPEACHSLMCAFKKMMSGFKGRIGRMGCHGGKVKSALKDAADEAYRHGVPAVQNAQQKAEKIIKEEHDRLREKFHDHGDILRLVKSLVSHIFLPIVLGVSAGVGVAALAMVTANVIMAFTRCLFGRREADDATEVVWYENLAATRYPAGVKVSELSNDSATDGLLENQAAAPEYQHDSENEKV